VSCFATIGNAPAPRITELMEVAKSTKEDVLKSKEKRTTMFDDGIEPLFE
jgi:hypothetical protein